MESPEGEFTDIASGGHLSCGRKPDGTAYCWGYDWFWDRVFDPRGAALKDIVVGGGEACALDDDGEAHCTGNVPSMRPTPGRYAQLSLGDSSGCGVLYGGGVNCWGAALGATPAAPMTRVSVGEAHACGVRTDGAVVCWGDNRYGQADAPPGRYLTVAAGDRYTCAIASGGTVECWGQDPLVSGVPVGGGFRTLVASANVVCASPESEYDPSQCWGDDTPWLASSTGYRDIHVAALGDHFVCYQSWGYVFCKGDTAHGVPEFSDEHHIAVAAAGDRACAIALDNVIDCSDEPSERRLNTMRIGTGAIAAGAAHTCNQNSSGILDCWGDNARGQRDAPQAHARAFSANGDHACAIADANTLRCWGDVSRGDLLPLPGVAVRDVDVGQYYGCAVRGDGGIACWGWNVNGQGTPPAGAFRRVATGLNHSCGLRDDNTLACWGYGADGQTAAPAGEFIAVDVGERHSCAITADGGLRCWGMDSEGQSAPPMDGRATYRGLSTGAFHNCAVRTDGTLLCWGRNSQGQSAPPLGRFASVSAGVVHSCAVRDDGVRLCWGDNGSGQQPSMAIGPETLPRGEINGSYEARLAVTGSAGYVPPAVAFRVVSGALPLGIDLDTDGQLHGWPQVDGASDFVVEARDAIGFSGHHAYRIQIGSPKDVVMPPEFRPPRPLPPRE